MCIRDRINSGARLDLDANLTVAGAVTVNDELHIRYGSLTVTSGDFTNNDDIIVYAGKFLNIATGTLTNTDLIDIRSSASQFGSLLLSNTLSNSGDIRYSRYVAGENYWDLIGSPLSGYNVEDFILQNDDIIKQGTEGNYTYAVGTYTNTAAAYSSNEGWTNYTTATMDDGTLTPGKGYQMATGNGAEITFKGDIETSDVSISVTTNEQGTINPNDGTKFALVANPYASYLSVASFLNAHKTNELHSNHVAVYGWDGSAYDTYSLASAGNGIAPGQGFMIGV